MLLVVFGLATALPQRPFRPRPGGIRPGAVLPGAGLGGPSIGFGNGGAGNGLATGTGVGQAQAPPGGFGAALGVGGAIATPFGNLAIGQGQGVAVGRK